MLRIELSGQSERVVFTLSGRIGSEHLAGLRGLLKSAVGRVIPALDLTDVRLVDRDAVRFLALCKSEGIELNNCPAYIREWMQTRKS